MTKKNSRPIFRFALTVKKKWVEMKQNHVFLHLAVNREWKKIKTISFSFIICSTKMELTVHH